MIDAEVFILRPDMVVIDPSARVDKWVKIEGGCGVTIGKHVHIASFAHVGIGGGTVILGEGASVASGAKIISGSSRPGKLGMSAAMPGVTAEKHTTTIGPYASVLTNAVVLPGVTMGKSVV